MSGEGRFASTSIADENWNGDAFDSLRVVDRLGNYGAKKNPGIPTEYEFAGRTYQDYAVACWNQLHQVVGGRVMSD